MNKINSYKIHLLSPPFRFPFRQQLLHLPRGVYGGAV